MAMAEAEEEERGGGGMAWGWKLPTWWFKSWLAVTGTMLGWMKAEFGRRKEGVACGMGCCSCRALIRGSVLLVRVVAEPGRDIPLALARGLPLLRMTTPAPRRDRVRVPPEPPVTMPPEL